MEKINTILDRKPINSEYINSKQDFNKVLDGFQQLKPPVWNSGWFYGAVGIAAIAVIFTAVSLTSEDIESDTKLASTTTVITAFNTPEKSVEEKTEVIDTELASIEKVKSNAIVPVYVAPNPNVEKPQVLAKVIPVNESVIVAESVEIKKPNIAGVFNGLISFEDFCDPLGIQVNDKIIITEYTIRYNSCTQDVTARVRGSKIPLGICDELRYCGARTEITFEHIKGYDKKTGDPVKFDAFTVVPVP